MAPPILVTGSHRSGTTWAGRMLALDPGVRYIHEPFNLDARTPTMRLRPGHWFEYVCPENEAELLDPMREVIDGRYQPRRGRSERTGGRVRRSEPERRRRRSLADRLVARLHPRRPLLKDPIALMAAPWLADRFGCEVIVMVRHPAAFASSLKRLDWRFDFRNWTDQPLFMRDLAGPHDQEIRAFAERERDITDQSILLWNVMHRVIAGYRERYPAWTFVRHEDLCEAPVEEFRRIYRTVRLRWTDEIDAAVRASSPEDGPAEVAMTDRNATVRNSRAARWTWVQRLTAVEQERVREGTREVAAWFYTEEDWSAPPEFASGSA